MKIVLSILLSFIVLANSFSTKSVNKPVRNQPDGFVVVELFTSEGCSSCPPADELLEAIQKKYAGKKVLVLAYHVDYWDRLGWKDIFSDALFTKRQEYYAAIFNLNTIYTPQAVVNGSVEFVGSNRSELLNAVDENIKTNKGAAINLDVSENASGKMIVKYSTEGNVSSQDQLVLLVVQKSATNKIRRGENEGKTLHHINIVRAMSALPVSSKEETISFNFPTGLKKEDVFIAAFKQNKNTGKISGIQSSQIN